MEELEKIRQWLLSFPDWGDDTLTVDCTDGSPGSAGLYPQGLEEVSRRTDVQGNTLVKHRLHFLLRRITTDQPNESGAAWLYRLQCWAQQQSILGKLPQLGCLPRQERICASDGKLLERSPGIRVYQLRFFAEYMTYQEGWVSDGSGV